MTMKPTPSGLPQKTKTTIQQPGGTPTKRSGEKTQTRSRQLAETSETQKEALEKRSVKTKQSFKLVDQKYQKFTQLAKTQNDKLTEKTEELKTILWNLNLPSSVNKKVTDQLDQLIKLRKAFNKDIVSNLQHMGKTIEALKEIDQTQDFQALDNILDTYGQLLGTLSNKNIESLTQKDFQDIQEKISQFIAETEKLENIDESQKKEFISTLNQLNDSFKNTINALSKKSTAPLPSSGDEAIQIEEEMNLTQSLLQDIHEGINQELQQKTIGAIIAIIGLAIVVAAVTIALTILTSGTGALLLGIAIAGGSTLTGYGTSEFFEINNHTQARDKAGFEKNLNNLEEIVNNYILLKQEG